MSYLTHEGKRDPVADIALADRLIAAGHMSPTEHAARPLEDGDPDGYIGDRTRYPRSVYWKDGSWWSGNFRGWLQYRATIPGESDILGSRA